MQVDERSPNEFSLLPRGLSTMHKIAPDLVGPLCELLRTVEMHWSSSWIIGSEDRPRVRESPVVRLARDGGHGLSHAQQEGVY